MRFLGLGRWLWIGLLLGGAGAAPGSAGADVPRACIYPTYDPLECPVQMRKQLSKVLSPARLRVRDEIRRRIEEGRHPRAPEHAPKWSPSLPGGPLRRIPAEAPPPEQEWRPLPSPEVPDPTAPDLRAVAHPVAGSPTGN